MAFCFFIFIFLVLRLPTVVEDAAGIAGYADEIKRSVVGDARYSTGCYSRSGDLGRAVDIKAFEIAVDTECDHAIPGEIHRVRLIVESLNKNSVIIL